MILCTSLPATILVALLIAESSKADYGQINKYLVAHVDNDEVGPNMEAASSWLKEERSRWIPRLSSAPISDLEQFVALQQVIDNPKCDGTDYWILYANDEAVDLYGSVFYEQVTDRILKVMYEIFKQHAKKCRPVYIDAHQKKKEQLDRVVAERVATLTEVLLEKGRVFTPKFVYYSLDHLFERYIRRAFNVNDYIGRHSIKTAIETIGKGDPDLMYLKKISNGTGNNVVETSKVKELVQKYLIEPCRVFVTELGPDLYIPARLDSEFYNDVEESNRDYYLTWVSFMICQALTQDEESILSELAESIRE